MDPRRHDGGRAYGFGVMRRVGLTEAKAQLSALLDAVEAGEGVVIARRWIETGDAAGLRAADGLHLAMAHRQGLHLVSAAHPLQPA